MTIKNSIMSSEFIYKNSKGVYILNLEVCDSSVLRYLLHSVYPYIWLRGHMPNPYLEWWVAPIPLGKLKETYEITVRGVVYDIQLQLSTFIDYLSEFAQHGMELYQVGKPVPDSLTLDRIPEDKRIDILLQNDVKTAFFLPHPQERAQFWAVDRNVVEQALENPQIQKLAIKKHS